MQGARNLAARELAYVALFLIVWAATSPAFATCTVGPALVIGRLALAVRVLALPQDA